MKVYTCNNCGSPNVETKVWVKLNGDPTTILSGGDNSDKWENNRCVNCETLPNVSQYPLREAAMRWWNNYITTPTQRNLTGYHFPGRDIDTLTGIEIEKIYKARYSIFFKN